MMQPNQINNQRFSAVGKGGYKASEVDAFIQRVYQNYNKLYNENNVLKERLSAISPLIDEYNDNKRAIADALIWAKTTSDKTISDAQKEAESIIGAAEAEGEKIIEEKTAEAQAVYSQELNSTKISLENAKTELEMTRSQAKSFSERYISEINAKAQAIVGDANSNAAKIVADAYKDAKTARDLADSIIAKANEEISSIKAEALKLKAEIEEAVKAASEAVSVFSAEELCEQTVPEGELIEAKQIDISEIEEFTFDFSEQEASEDLCENIKAAEEIPSNDNDIDENINPFEQEAVLDALVEEEPAPINDDFISGGATASAMPDVSAYISKIFDSAGNEDSDFSSFADGLNDVFAQSLEESDISFDDLKKTFEDDSKKETEADEE